MKELSLHILDLAQNSIAAGASRVVIAVEESAAADTLRIAIEDDGCGMEADFLRQVTDPFTTTRKTRRVGLGIPLLKLQAELTGGSFHIESAPGKGTRLEAVFGFTHIDRPPLGDMASTLTALVQGAPELDIVYRRRTDLGAFTLDTAGWREVLAGVSINEPEVLAWMRDYIAEGEEAVQRNETN